MGIKSSIEGNSHNSSQKTVFQEKKECDFSAKIPGKNLHKSKILKNFRLSENIFLCEMERPADFNFSPGQFINILIDEFSSDPFLRRPFSIFDLTAKSITLLYQIKGKGTKILSEKRTGEILDYIGPLGKPFILDENAEQPFDEKSDNDMTNHDEKVNVFIAGGIGIASVLLLAKQINERDRGINLLFYGVKKNELLIPSKYYQNTFKHIYLACDQPSKSRGKKYYKGNILDYLNNEFNSNNPHLMNQENIRIFACGPDIMLRAFTVWNKDKKIKAQISLESFMGCGFKACLGCAVKTINNEYEYVCHDGPVFPWDYIAFE